MYKGKVREIEIVQPGEEKAKGDFIDFFTWQKEVIEKVEPGSSQRLTMLGQEKRIKKPSFVIKQNKFPRKMVQH